jgi:hypothetical protein
MSYETVPDYIPLSKQKQESRASPGTMINTMQPLNTAISAINFHLLLQELSSYNITAHF